MTRFFHNAVKSPVLTIMLLVLVFMIAFVAGDINNMQTAKNTYEYYLNLCYLVENISISYFMCIFIMMLYLTYVNEQYSKWTIRLFNFLGVSSLAYFVVAGQVYEYVFYHSWSENMDKLPSLARTVFTGPVYWIIIGYFFIPKILKDAQKIKEEQELTI